MTGAAPLPDTPTPRFRAPLKRGGMPLWRLVLDSDVSPTVRSIGPYRFFFFASDLGEPPHLHAERDRATARSWRVPVVLAGSRRFPARELRRLEELVRVNAAAFLEAWHEFHRR
jgi:hypothetical protein